MDAVEGTNMAEEQRVTRTASEAGWHLSRYNIRTRVPETDKTVIVNLLKGTCLEYSPIELYFMSALDEISESHPIINLLEKRGVICNYDEVAAIEAASHIIAKRTQAVGLVICPTMTCNFDCPYCFENHYAGKMSASVQDDVISLAERLMEVNAAKALKVTWFGGEPLLASEVIESLSGRLITLADERGAAYDASIITNGYLLDQDMVDRLARCKVNAVQITLDGLGAIHDSTRHLSGGGPTFERIVRNLRECDIPFCIFVRHNVHEGNRCEMGELESFVGRLSDKSGNEMHYFSARVVGSEAAEGRGRQVRLLCGPAEMEVALEADSRRFGRGRAAFCGANGLEGVAIDHLGNLYQCWEVVGNQAVQLRDRTRVGPSEPTDLSFEPRHADMLSECLRGSPKSVRANLNLEALAEAEGADAAAARRYVAAQYVTDQPSASVQERERAVRLAAETMTSEEEDEAIRHLFDSIADLGYDIRDDR